MSGLFGTLNSGIQAINSQAKALEVTSKNLSNVNNPDYARQRVQFGDRGTVMTQFGAQSLGLEAIGVEHLRDQLLDSAVRREVGISAALTAEGKALKQAEATLGEQIERSSDGTDLEGTSGGYGLSDALTDLFGSFYRVANNPTDIGERQSLLSQADILTDRLNATDQRLADLQDSLDVAIDSDMKGANQLLETIAALNSQIGRFEIGNPGSAVDLRDQREAAMEKLSGLLDFETRASAGGVGQLDILVRDTAGNAIPLVTLAQVTGNLSAPDGVVSAGEPAAALALKGGALKGHTDARDGAIGNLRDQLDILAGELVREINALYNPTGAETDFFVPGGTTASTIRLAPTFTVASLRTSTTASPGANDLATAIADLSQRTFSSNAGDAFNGSFLDFYTAAVTDLGNAVNGTNARATNQKAIENLVRTQRDATSAVSLDEEMVNLMKYQRAFEASARVVQIVDELLDVIVNRLVR